MLVNFQIFHTDFDTRNNFIFCTQLRYYVKVLFAELIEKKLAEKNSKLKEKLNWMVYIFEYIIGFYTHFQSENC
jgi:hypothetical protein